MNTEKAAFCKTEPLHFFNTDKIKLELIDKIINAAYEYPAADPTSWSGFLEGTLNAIAAVANFGESESE